MFQGMYRVFRDVAQPVPELPAVCAMHSVTSRGQSGDVGQPHVNDSAIAGACGLEHVR
jgi:hypothetical protein